MQRGELSHNEDQLLKELAEELAQVHELERQLTEEAGFPHNEPNMSELVRKLRTENLKLAKYYRRVKSELEANELERQSLDNELQRAKLLKEQLQQEFSESQELLNSQCLENRGLLVQLESKGPQLKAHIEQLQREITELTQGNGVLKERVSQSNRLREILQHQQQEIQSFSSLAGPFTTNNAKVEDDFL